MSIVSSWLSDPDFAYCHRTKYAWWNGPEKYCSRVFTRVWKPIEPDISLPKLKCSSCGDILCESLCKPTNFYILRCKCRTRITHVECGINILDKMSTCPFCNLKISYDNITKSLIEVC